MQAYRVHALVTDGGAAGHGVGRDVLSHKRPTLYHGVRANFRELVCQYTAANHRIIAHLNLAGELHGVRHDDVVTQHAVVCHVAVGHDQAVVANDGLATRCSSAVNGNKLANRRVVADDGHRFLALELEILRDIAHHGTCVDVTVASNACTGANHGVAVDDAAVANHHIVVDSDKGPDFHVIANLCSGVDASQRLKFLIIHIV